MQTRVTKALAWGSLVIALLLFSKSGYMYLKAELSQVLIERAWDKAVAKGRAEEAKPWSWADTYPIAKMTFHRDHNSLYVLEGTSGEALAFGPGHYRGTALPAEQGDSVIAGHRDSHFSFLRDAKIGDIFSVENYKRTKANYQIEQIKIVDSTKEKINIQKDIDRLQLVTCYPFDAIRSGGPLRYVLYAKRLDRDY